MRESIPAGHPAIARAAKLLARRPDFAAPLAAFVDLLSQTAALGNVDNDAKVSQPAETGESKGQDTREANTTGTDNETASGAESGEAARVGAANINFNMPQKLEASGRTAAPERQGWIPILGRSATGIPHFWRETGEGSGGATALADLVARMRPRGAAGP